MATMPRPTPGNGRGHPAELEQERKLLAAMAEAHEFPGYYPVVVIARRGEGFEATLRALVAAEQGSAPYRIKTRSSRNGSYVSYRVEVYVADAVVALARKASLSALEGVLVLL